MFIFCVTYDPAFPYNIWFCVFGRVLFCALAQCNICRVRVELIYMSVVNCTLHIFASVIADRVVRKLNTFPIPGIRQDRELRTIAI